MAERPLVRPRDAASLILLREGKSGLEVLIGRRGKGARFMPGRYVFPGGRITASDTRPWLDEAEDGEAARFVALKRAALRETFEETNLVVGRQLSGRRANGEAGGSPVEQAYHARGIAPAPDLLRLVGRAITPTASPIRFHARFFLADGRYAVGDIIHSEELEDLRWHPIADDMPSMMQNVTKFMLRCAIEAWKGTAPSHPPLYWHRGRRSLVRHGQPAR
ncbi:MAG TPA: NUDIX domain-containing protein [Stellaceae bacterium]|nr:NUDIX domain-containing protein [Stellaceae bacterium]